MHQCQNMTINSNVMKHAYTTETSYNGFRNKPANYPETGPLRVRPFQDKHIMKHIIKVLLCWNYIQCVSVLYIVLEKSSNSHERVDSA